MRYFNKTSHFTCEYTFPDNALIVKLYKIKITASDLNIIYIILQTFF